MTETTTITDALVDAVARLTDMGRAPLLLSVVGSHAYGTEREGSDVDLRGCWLAPTRDTYRLQPPQETVDLKDPDIVVHELRKFCKLAAAGNPNILEALWAPRQWLLPGGEMLSTSRHLFLSRRVFYTYGGYARSQWEKYLRGSGGSRGREHFKREKFLLHLFRLMMQGTDLLATGRLEVRLTESQRRFIDRVVKLGTDDERASWMLDWERKLDEAREASPLPEQPRYAEIDELLIALREGEGDML